MKNFIILFAMIMLALASNFYNIDSNGYIRDQQNRIVQYHGFNVVYKPAPFLPVTDKFDPITSFSEEDCQTLRQLGFNIIRLHVAFEAAMPIKGEINDDYLYKIKDIVQLAAKYNISVILDAHQDLLNRQFCGEGLPDWAVKKIDFPAPQNISLRFDEKGYPLIEDCLQQNFAKFYLTSDVGRNYEAFLKNEDGVADMFGLFWQRVASIFKNEPNVLGYEILNEPIAANWQRSKFEFLLPGWGNNHLILGFYQLINKYIREVDQETLVFFEPYFTDVFGGGFKENVGGKEFQKKEVLSYHVYCGVVDSIGQPKSQALCQLLHSIFVRRKKSNQMQLGTGAFLTEFGATSNTDKSRKMLNSLLANAEKYQHSWTYWQYKGFNDYTSSAPMEQEGFYKLNGEIQEEKAKALVRPYALAVCGKKIIKSKFYPRKQKFILNYKTFNSEQCFTELYIPQKYNLENGFKVKFKKCKSCLLVKTDHVGYYRIEGQFKTGSQIKLEINGY